jgi:tetratricopeptide (TPR) repeat protein
MPLAAPYRLRSLRAVVAALPLLAACAQPQTVQAPASETAVIEANRRADASFRSGNFEGAVRYYREAIRIAQSVEDVDAIAANAVNLSIAYQRLGRIAEARAALALVLEQRGGLKFSAERLAQAALRRSVLDLDEHSLSSAREWAEQAATQCSRESGCALMGAIHNVRGQIALEEGRPDEAAASAKAALAASRSSGDRTETANALRLLGLAALRSGDAAAARSALGESLAIDRELALSRKIYLDLVGLGRASALGGDRAAARLFYERALSVSEADRDAKGTADVRALMNALGGPPGPNEAGVAAGADSR